MMASGVTGGGIGPRGWWAEHGMRALVPAPAELAVALRTIDQHVESNLARARLTQAA